MEIIIDNLKNSKETLWINPSLQSVLPGQPINGQKYLKLQAAQNRFMRFLPFIAQAFPETAAKKGVIESELINADSLKNCLNNHIASADCQPAAANANIPSSGSKIAVAGEGIDLPGKIFIKDDAHLPIAGSVKARGGIHEVLHHAEVLAQRAELIKPGDDYSKFASAEFRRFFSDYKVQVGSTGNLGISIGITASKLGFKTIVHMSRDAREWKKELLRKNGVEVCEYEGDYSEAVKAGRLQSSKDPMSYFVDDENSEDLFMGYATAALRLKVQLYVKQIPVDKNHPLFVFLPCGVGGAPGGITFGLKEMYGDDVHCFFAEPTAAPCFTLGMASGKHEKISIGDIGLSGRTIADGLAVGRPSGFVCNMMEHIVSGAFTVSDEALTKYQRIIYDNVKPGNKSENSNVSVIAPDEGLYLEPSACAGLHGLKLLSEGAFDEYLKAHDLTDKLADSTFIIWATGGGLVPPKLQFKN